MDRADFFKKKGSTVDAKFARLHRRSIDQRTVRGKSFMDNRNLAEKHFSPLKEDHHHGHGANAAMPPPIAAPLKAAKKGNGTVNRSASQPQPQVQVQGLTRREKLMKWKEEKEMKKRQMSNIKKPSVFRVSASIDRKAEHDLYVSAQVPKGKPHTHSVHKPVQKAPPKAAPAPTRMTRSSARSQTANDSRPVKEAPATRTSARNAMKDPVPSKKPRQTQPPTTTTSSTKAAPARSGAVGRAPVTRHSARLASKVPPPQKEKPAPHPSTRGKRVPMAQKPVEEISHIEEEEEIAPQSSLAHQEELTADSTFVPKDSKGFTFSMQLPDIPFTPISPASASSFLFPSVAAATTTTRLTPSQRRCSTPYSLRTRKSLARTPHQGEVSQDIVGAQRTAMGMTWEGEQNDGVDKETPAEVCPVQADELETQEVKTVQEPMQVTMEAREPEVEVAMETGETEKRIEDSKPEVKSEIETKANHIQSSGTAAAEGLPAQTGVEKDVQYFKNLVSSETTRLLDRCEVWEKVMRDEHLSEEVCGEIRSTIGKAKLLIDQRFKQFLGLIKNCEFGLGEKVTHCSDLEGFWEMIYFQVEDVDSLFKDLEKLRDNGWKKEQKTVKPKVIKKKKPVTKKSEAAAGNRMAARERLLAAKAAMKAKATRQADAEKVVFEGGFFKVESPARKNITEHCQAGSPFRTSKRNTPASRTATPKFVTTPASARTRRVVHATSSSTTTPPQVYPSGTLTVAPQTSNTPTVAQLFSPIAEPRRSLRTKLCGEISRLVLSDKKATPNTRRTPARAAKENAGTPGTPKEAMNKENEVDLAMYLMPCVDLNKQAEDLMVTEPEDQLQQLGSPSPKKSLRPRRSFMKPKDPFSPSVNLQPKVLHNGTNTNLCSPLQRKTRKSSLGFGLSQAASLFTPTSTPEPCNDVDVADLICFN